MPVSSVGLLADLQGCDRGNPRELGLFYLVAASPNGWVHSRLVIGWELHYQWKTGKVIH